MVSGIAHRVRQRLTELGLAYTTRRVPVAREARTELQLATGDTEIPLNIRLENTVRASCQR